VSFIKNIFSFFPNSTDKLKKKNSLGLTRRITAIGMSILVGFSGIDIPVLADGSEGGDNIENQGGEGQGENQGGAGQGETQGGAEKTAVAVPALTGWSDGTVANWELVENCNYNVFLYREGEQEAIASATGVTVGSYDFSESFLSAGKYTYKVQAVPTDAISETSKESDLSSEAGYSYAVSVSISQGEHITSVSPASTLLIAGMNGRNSVSISAEADTEGGWVFDSWTGVPEGMTLSNGAESRENTLSIDGSYSGELSVSLTATGKEDPTPVIPAWEVYPSSNVNLTYSAETQVINACLDVPEENVTYKWFKKTGDEFTLITGSSGSRLSVRDVADSGVYKVSADYTITKKTGTVINGTLEGEPFNVNIAKAPLSVKADTVNVTYLEDGPGSFTFKYYGLLGDDGDSAGDAAPSESAKITSAGNFTCSYASGDNAGNYWIVQDHNGGAFSSDNYEITVDETGILNVAPKAAGEGTNVSAVLESASCKYTGSAVTPGVIVTDGDIHKTLTSEDYSVSYFNNTSMGSADDANGPRAVVTFKRNYTGSITLHFDITKGAYIPVVTIADYTPGEWIYGGDSKSLSVGNFPDDMTDAEKANYRIYYVSGHKSQEEINKLSTGSVNQPVDAGDYTAFAIVGSSSKYESTHSAPCHFTISPKTITLTAGSGSWVYDGNAHTNSSFSPSKDDADSQFVKSSESFKSIEVGGSITDVGTAANKISYTLSSSTKASNYNIVCVDGVLEVTPTALPSPAGCEWDEAVAGRATWVAVAKKDLTVKYKVTLYAYNPATKEKSVIPVNGQDFNICESNSIDFAEAIHTSADNSDDAKSYYFTVKTVSFGGKSKNNYADSADCGTSPMLYSATITIDRSYCGVDQSEKIKRLDLGTFDQRITLIQGESVIIYGEANEGYTLNDFRSSDGNISYASLISKTNLSKEGTVSRARLSLTSDMHESLPNVKYTAYIVDTFPTLKSFTAENLEDLSGVKLKATVSDFIGLDAYRFVPVTKDAVTGTYSVSDDTVEWVSLGEATGDKTVTGNVYASGLYGIQVRDVGGNVLPPHKGISVYEIQFDPGEGSGSMSPVFKAENTAPVLPANAFTKDHYQFKYWSGAKTGISVDGAAMVANVNDTLVAQWTNEKVNYTVNYFYMNGNGEYPAQPEVSAVFQGNHGDVIDVNNSDIQKPRANYSLDTSDGHNDSVSLVPENYPQGIVLNVYYKTGQYSVTYTYRLPGEDEDTVIVQNYYYNQAISEADKPSAPGYDFVGWEFGGSGVAPETMPANDLYASGTFKAKDTTFKVVYHLETIGNGEAKTGIFAVNDDLTRVLKAKTDDSITALLDGEENAGTVVAGTVEGFTLKTVSVSYGAADGESLPEIADTKAGTVKYDPSETLYINYYYERNVYDLFVDVYKGSRESETNHIFRHTEKHQYQEQLDIDKFSEPDYYLGQSAYGSPAKDDSGNDFSMPQGFVFASYTDYSTGNKPSKMPAGDMSITKDVISNENAEFKLELYFETGTIGEYELKSTLVYDYPIGGNIHIVADKRDDEGNDYFLAYNDFVKTVNNYGYYTHTLISETDANGNLSKEEGVVLDDDSLVLKVYFERRSTTATVSYKYKATGGEETEIAKYRVTGKWGTSFAFDPDLLFDSISEDEARDRLAALGSNITTDAEFTNNGLSTDFRNASYLVSYTSHYRYFNANGIVTNTYPSYTFTTIGSGIEVDPGYPAKSVSSAGISDTVLSYFSVDDTYNRVTVYYNQISEKEDFYLDVRILNTHLKDPSFDWWTSLGGAVKTYPDGPNGTTAVPVLYGYDGDAETDGEEYYQVRVINKCAVVTAATKSEAAAGLGDYPAANAKSRSYDYTGIDLNDANNLHPGCKYIGGDYFFYNPSLNTGEKTGAFGNEAVVFKVDSSDRFLQGAYVSYGIGSETPERAFCDDFLSNYQDEHDEDSGRYEPERTALAYDNLSYGGTYVSGDHGYLNVYYYYRENCRLSFYFNGSIYSNQVANSYVYGSVVPKEDVKCDSVEKRTGYDVAWYTDEAYSVPVPDEGLTMDRNRTVYGRYEKSTIRNMEYIYYQLADPITVGGNTYNYVNQDNLDDIIAKLESEGKTLSKEESAAQVNVGTSDVPIYKTAKTIKYFLDEAPVFTSIERPTLTYTEITLSKQDADYEEYYLDGYDGFFYNETNTDNRSYGYVNTTPIILKVYFARDQYNVEVLNNVSETDNPELRKFSIGQHVALASPVKGGYTFDHWNWKKWNGSSYEDFTPVIEAGEEYFKMPGFDLQASAQYVPAAFDQKIVHLFQKEDSSYSSDFISLHETGGTAADVTFGDRLYQNADIWGAADAPEAVRIVTESGVLYFAGASLRAGQITVSESDLVAAVTEESVTSENTADLDSFALPDASFELFGYSYGLYKDGLSVVRYAKGASGPKAKYGMEIELYYARSANYTVELSGIATDGAESGLIISGAGMYFFGENATISAHLSDGYTFIGWFDESDIENGLIKSGAHALSTNTEMTIPVREDIKLVALVKPNETIAPTLRFSGKESYTYGYADSADNTITAIAGTSFTAQDEECIGLSDEEIAALNAQAQKTKITGYQWYLVKTNEDGSEDISIPEGTTSSATYRFTPGKNAGTYTYRIKVMYERTDNGRSAFITKDFDVVVNKAPMSVTTTSYHGIYDNRFHSISLSVKKPGAASDYEIYYHPDTQITAENFNTLEGITGELPLYKDVKVDAQGHETCHTTYIYIKDKTGNYEDYIGEQDVWIDPKTVSIKPTNNIFSKMYDGSVKVNGSVTEVGSDLYRLSRGEFYTVQGYVDGDADTRAYILDCNANYDSEHVRTAKAFVVSDMKIVNRESGDVIYNYVFPESATLSFTGNITARPLDIEWVFPEETVEVEGETVPYYTYNGELQGPGIRLSENQTYPIPALDADISETLSVSGKQENAGLYSAVAAVSVNDQSHYESSDYSFSITNQKYVIGKRPVVVTPVEKTVTYNGTRQTITEYIANGLIDSHTSTAQSAKSYVDAGVYEDMLMKNLVVSDTKGRDMKDNYEITYSPATLTIEKCPVRVSGITVGDKVFDGTKTVKSVDVSGAVFTPLYTNALTGKADKLSLDTSKISAVFTDERAGTGVAADITIAADALKNVGGMDCAKNYVLDVAGSQNSSQADIVKKKLYVIANDKEMKYKIGDENEEVPVFDWRYEGFVEGWGDETTFASKLGIIRSYVCEKNTDNRFVPTIMTVVGEYDIKLENTPVLDNYEVVFVKGVFTVSPSKINITVGNLKNLITISDKMYDGTTDVLPGKITVSDRKNLIADLADQTKGYDKCLLPEDAEYLINNPEVTIITFDFTGSRYTDSKNVGTNKPVHVDYELGDWLSSRYELSDTDKEAFADINVAPLSITPEDMEISYGDERPRQASFSYTATGLVAGETIENTPDFSGSLVYATETYSDTLGAYSDVNISDGYPITVSGITNGNYDITFNEGKLTVKKSALQLSAPIWSDNSIGSVTWNPVSRIGDVEVAGYELKLLKDGAEVQSVNAGPLESSYDFADKMHEETGSYTVSVKAIASTEQNAGNKNVDDSEIKVTASSKEVVKVTVSFEDSVSSGKGESILIDGAPSDPVYLTYEGDDTLRSSLNAIEGEKLSFAAHLSVDTGYTATTTVSADPGPAASHMSVLQSPSLNEREGKYIYEGKLLVSGEIDDASEILNAKIGLIKTPARVDGSLTASKDFVTYGFTNEEAPAATASPKPVVGDNVGLDGYSYTYTWFIEDTENNQFTSSGLNEKLTGSDESVYELPSLNDFEKKLESGEGRYRISCLITATRLDNAESATKTLGPVAISVRKASYNPLVRFDEGGELKETVNRSYGESKPDPVVTNAEVFIADIPGEDIKDYITWQYSSVGEAGPWTDYDPYDPLSDSKLYTKAGTYYVRAKIAESSNYLARTTGAVIYKMDKIPLTITGKDLSKEYDGVALTYESSDAVPGDGFTIGGLLTGDTLSALTLSGKITSISQGAGGNTASNTPGNAVIVNPDGEDVTSCYDITYVPGSLTISQRPLTITAGSLTGSDAPIYDGQFHTKADGYGITEGTLAPGDSISVSMTEASKIKNAGSVSNDIGAVTIRNASGADVTPSYEIAKISGSLEVLKRDITIAPDNAERAYGEKTTDHTWRVILGEIQIPGEIAVTVNDSTDIYDPVGSYDGALSITASSPNYNITTESADLTIVRGEQKILAEDIEFIYDGNEHLLKDLESGWSIKKPDGEDLSYICIDESGSEISAEGIKEPGILRVKLSVPESTNFNAAEKIISIRVKEKPDPVQTIPASDSGNATQGESSFEAVKPEAVPSQSVKTEEIKKDAGEESKDETEGGDEAEKTSENSAADAKNPEDAENQSSYGSSPDLPENYIGTGDGRLIVIGTDTEGSEDEKIIDCEVLGADIVRMLDELLTGSEKERLSDNSRVIFRVEVDKTGPDAEKALAGAGDYTDGHGKIAGSFDSTFFVTIQGEKERKIEEKYSSVRVSFEIPEELKESFGKKGTKILSVTIGEDGMPLIGYIDFDILGDMIVMDMDNYSTYVVVEDEGICFIHWIIVLLLIISILTVIIYYVRKDRDSKEKVSKDEEDERRFFRLHLLIVTGSNIAGFILAVFFRHCRWDLPAELLNLICTVLMETIFYNAAKNSNGKKKEAAGTQKNN